MIVSGQDAETKKAEAKKLMDDFCTSEDIETWALTRRWLHEFSFGNQILLLGQVSARLADTELYVEHVSPIQAAWRWRNAGYRPAKTDTLAGALQGAFWVWTPQTKKKDADGSWLCETCRTRASGPRCAKGHRRKAVFVLKPVFSRLQVVSTEDGMSLPPEPPPVAALTGDDLAHLYPPLATWGRDELGVDTQIRDPATHPELGSAGGYYSPNEKLIVVRAGAMNEVVATLIHELAHACGITYEQYSRADAEAIVETAAYLACAALGLDTASRSLAYVARWAGSDGDSPAAAVQKHLRVIDELARRLERAALPPSEPEPEGPNTETVAVVTRREIVEHGRLDAEHYLREAG